MEGKEDKEGNYIYDFLSLKTDFSMLQSVFTLTVFKHKDLRERLRRGPQKMMCQ